MTMAKSQKTEQNAWQSLVKRLFNTYVIDALSYMAMGLFCSLILGLIIKQLSLIPGLDLLGDIAKLLQPHTATVIADSADPKSIEELRRAGVRIKGATKGTDSIRFGIQLMQEKHWYVTAESLNLIKELRGYVWETDKNGDPTGNPIGKLNHGIDGWRYWCLENLMHPFSGKYSII